MCDSCFIKLSKNKFDEKTNKKATQKKPSTASIMSKQVQSLKTQVSSTQIKKRSTISYDRYELVDDYAERIKKARESLGWSQSTLAVKAKVSENIIKRIESGKLRPSFDLAKKLEEILNIRLLVPIVEEELKKGRDIVKEVTLGEIVNIRGEKE